MVIIDCDTKLNIMGVLRSQVFLNSKVTFEEAVAAVKQDISRSLSTRMELHWDSLIEEEYGSPEGNATIVRANQNKLILSNIFSNHSASSI